MSDALNHFPLKHAYDAAALAKVLIRGDIYYGRSVGLGARLKCIDYYFRADGCDRLFAALFRSGSLWSELGVRLAIDLARGGDGEYTYKGGLYFPRDGLAYRRLDWRVPLGLDDEAFQDQRGDDGPAFGPLLYHHSRHPYFRIRSARLKKMKIVVLTRSILDVMESRYVKFRKQSLRAGTPITDENMFDWDNALTRAIEFYNSWGEVLTWHPSILHVRYEDLKADEVGGHREVLKFWGFDDVPDDCIAEGFRRASKKEMAKRMPQTDSDTDFRAAKRSESDRGSLSDDRKQRIIGRLQRELRYDMGYTYDMNTSYGKLYD